MSTPKKLLSLTRNGRLLQPVVLDKWSLMGGSRTWRFGWYSVLCKVDLGAQLISLLLTLGLVPRKMVEFNPGLSKILSKVFLLSKNMYEHTVVPLRQEKEIITQNVTPGNA